MPSKLCRWGNSLGLRLPSYVTERTGLAAGDYLYITLLDNGQILIRPVKAKSVPEGYVMDAKVVTASAAQGLRLAEW